MLVMHVPILIVLDLSHEWNEQWVRPAEWLGLVEQILAQKLAPEFSVALPGRLRVSGCLVDADVLLVGLIKVLIFKQKPLTVLFRKCIVNLLRRGVLFPSQNQWPI